MPKAIGQITIRDENDISIGTTAPSSPIKDQMWLDTSVNPSQLKRYNGSSWDIVNDFEIGGRNLAKNTANFTVMDYWGSNAGKTISIEDKCIKGITSIKHEYTNLEPGKTYMITMIFKTDADIFVAKDGYGGHFHVVVDGQPDAHYGKESCVLVSAEPYQKNVFKKYIYKIVVKNGVTNPRLRCMVYDNGYLTDKTIWLKSLKVEEGTKATDWTPAPEDTEEKITANTTSINVVQGQISALISENTITKGDVTTLKNNYTSIKATVDGINTTVASHTSSIGSLNTNLSGVSTKVTAVENKQATLEQDLSGFKTTVSNTYSTKAELNTVDGKVSSLSSRVNTAESSITQLNNKIALKVEQTDITNAINNLSIGGRNLIKYSAPQTANVGWYGTAGTRELVDELTAPFGKALKATYTASGSTGGLYLVPYNKLTVGLTYSWSVWLKSNKNLTMHVGMEQGGKKMVNVTPTWQKFTHTFVATNTASYAFSLYTNVSVVSGDFYIAHSLMCAEGNKLGDWTPAPEDIDSSISTVSNKVATIETSLTSITSRVSSTESSISTHTTQIGQVDGKISTAKTDAINTASTDATNKSNSALSNAKSYTDGQITTVNTTINNKVAEIKTTTDSIISRVSSTESSITTINGNVSSLTTKVTSVEQSITATALTTTISSAIQAGTSSISTTQFVMDKTGLTIKNGALTIQNKAGTNVLTSDTNGNLTISGTFINRNWNNVKAIQIDNTNITFYDWERSERELGYIYSSFISTAPNCRGFSLAHHNEGYMTLGYRRTDGTFGNYIVLDKYSKVPYYPSAIRVTESTLFDQAVNFQDRVYIPQAIYFDSANNPGTAKIYKGSGKNLLAVDVSVSNAGDGFGIWSNTGTSLFGIIAGRAYTINQTSTQISGNLSATGTKARLVNTQNYGGVKLNAVESADALFEDIGEGAIDELGLCYIYIDCVMQETINTKCSYQVFLQKYSEGDLFVLERNENYFVVKGTPNLRFGWRFAAKQKGYETERLEQEKINITEEYLNNIEHDKEVNYEDLAYSYLEDYEKELISVEY